MDVHWTLKEDDMTTATVDTERVNFRANRTTKREAERVLRAFGLNLSDGLNMFLARLAAEHRIPFPLAMTREEVLSSQTVALADAATSSIQTEVSRRISEDAPIARYDRALGQAYIQYADGRREYIGD